MTAESCTAIVGPPPDGRRRSPPTLSNNDGRFPRHRLTLLPPTRHDPRRALRPPRPLHLRFVVQGRTQHHLPTHSTSLQDPDSRSGSETPVLQRLSRSTHFTDISTAPGCDGTEHEGGGREKGERRSCFGGADSIAERGPGDPHRRWYCRTGRGGSRGSSDRTADSRDSLKAVPSFASLLSPSNLSLLSMLSVRTLARAVLPIVGPHARFASTSSLKVKPDSSTAEQHSITPSDLPSSPPQLQDPTLWQTTGFLNGVWSKGSASETFSVNS